MEREKKQALCLQALEMSRSELVRRYPALYTAFGELTWKLRSEPGFAADGVCLFACPDSVTELYGKEPAAVRRGYLHILLHCLYLHIFPPEGVDPADWDLACDIAAEQIVASLHDSRLMVPDVRREKLLGKLGSTPCTPAALLQMLDSFGCSRQELRSVFTFDDHRLWYAQTADRDAIGRKWKSIYAGCGAVGAGSRGTHTLTQEDDVVLLQESSFDYRRYLRQFTVPREELEPDLDGLDPIAYHLGLTHYGNIPLLEPPECRDVFRLEELAIAIDTSGSCSVEVVSRFLSDTWQILSDRENFFRRMRVFFFQCDCVLQDTAQIKDQEGWENYARSLKIRGRGGTDFTPVFRQIEALRAQGVLKGPRALLYFTDGDGIYPSVPPDYETVFVLAGENRRPDLVPVWAKTLIPEEETA